MPFKAIAHFVYRYQRKCSLGRLDGINEIIFEMLFCSGNQNPSFMCKLIIGIICATDTVKTWTALFGGIQE